eukprot:352338-Chlamydomonas_euryale.AAC.10
MCKARGRVTARAPCTGASCCKTSHSAGKPRIGGPALKPHSPPVDALALKSASAGSVVMVLDTAGVFSAMSSSAA